LRSVLSYQLTLKSSAARKLQSSNAKSGRRGPGLRETGCRFPSVQRGGGSVFHPKGRFEARLGIFRLDGVSVLAHAGKMKRNMDLVRQLLIRSEGDEEAAIACEKFTVEERAYHVQLLIDAGLVEGVVMKGPQGALTGALVSRLTWAGHDFLQSVREDTVWKKAKEQVLKPGASWTFEILKEWAKNELKQKLGLPVQ
jgi:hypothetical protein